MTKLPKWVKKLPKKVVICGRVYKIIHCMTREGAAFWLRDCIIELGCTYTQRVVCENLIHEISEIVHCEMRFRTENSDGYMFVMNHAQFQQHSMLLVAALRDCGILK